MVKIADSMDVNMSRDNILIVDALNLAFRWKHQGIFKFVDDYIKTVRSLAKSYKCGTIVIAADRGGSTYRTEIYPEYKANRKELYKDDTEAQKAETRKFFDEYEQVMERCNKEFILFRFQGVEADDIAAHIVAKRKELGYDQIWLISSDRDWDLLVSEHVNRFSTVTRKEQTLDTWDNPVGPDKYLTYKCLVGDKGDNIPGVDGVGPKRATSIIEEYGDIFDIVDALPIAGKYKYIQALNASRDQLLINIELMDLVTFSEEAVGRDNVRTLENRIAR
jgi:5'-3' exonuclease